MMACKRQWFFSTQEIYNSLGSGKLLDKCLSTWL